MATLYSPKIVTDGLVLALDIPNGESFRGEPTENFITNNPLPTSITSFTPSGGSGTSTYDENEQAVRWIRTSYETWGAYYSNNSLANYLFDTNSSYTVSFEWKFGPTHTAGTGHYFQIVQGNGQNIIVGNHNLISNSVLMSNGWYKFTRTQIPNNAGVSVTGQSPGFRLIVGNAGTNVTDIYWRKLQFEKKPYATPFVNGTRGTTVATGGGWANLAGSSNNGQLFNGVSYNTDGFGSLSFDGVDDYINCGNDASLNVGFGSVTVSAWYKRFTNAAGNLRVLAKGGGDDNANGFAFLGSDTGMSFIVTDLPNARKSIGVGSLSLDRWYNVTGVIDRSTNSLLLYLDGQFRTSRTDLTLTTLSGTSPLYIGANAPGSVHWSGLISNVQFYNRALSASEILQNYNSLKRRFGL